MIWRGAKQNRWKRRLVDAVAPNLETNRGLHHCSAAASTKRFVHNFGASRSKTCLLLHQTEPSTLRCRAPETALAAVHDEDGWPQLGVGVIEMPAAHMYRIGFSRLTYCVRFSPTLSSRLKHPPIFSLAVRSYSFAAPPSPINGNTTLASTHSLNSSSSPDKARVDLKAIEDGKKASDSQAADVFASFEQRLREGRRDSRQASPATEDQDDEHIYGVNSSSSWRSIADANAEAQIRQHSYWDRSPGHRQARLNHKKSKDEGYHPPSSSRFRKRAHRRHATASNRRRKAGGNRFSARYNNRPYIRPIYTPHQLSRKHGRYFQWGYIRHQHPASEILEVRRTFNKWIKKIERVNNPIRTQKCPWHDKAKWLFDMDDTSTMRKAWETLDVEDRRGQWPLTMLSTMYSCPDKASMVLEATLDPLPPGYAIHDVLLFVAHRLRLGLIRNVRERTIKAEETLELLVKFLDDTPSGHVPFAQRTLGLFARKLPSDQTSDLYSILQRSKRKLHPNTQLQFASKLASDMNHKETAFEILKGLADDGVNLNGPSPSSVITSLLHCKASDDGWSEKKLTFTPKTALQYFMEKGFAPNIISFTAFLDSLCQQSEVEEAIRLALLFSESGIVLDVKAWQTVFRGAKTSLNIENMIKGLEVAKAAKAPYANVLDSALHSIFYFGEMESRDKRMVSPWVLPLFGPMLHIYAKKFQLEPLQWWIPDSLPLILTQGTVDYGEKFEGHQPHHWDFLRSIVPAVDGFFSSGDSHGPRLRPSTTTIAIMLRAYIKSLQQPYDLMAFYHFFKTRLEERKDENQFAAELVKNQGSLVHDTIIMAMTERPGLSRPALQIFGDMLRDHLNVGETESSWANENVSVHPPPSLCTYSILIRGLMSQGDRILAEQVVQVMREHGIEPNLVTWNTLIKGYASMQNISRTVSALQDMEAAGLKPDLFTFKAFGKLRNQAKALEMMEGIINVNMKNLAGEDLYE